MDNNKNTEQEEKSETKKSVHLDSDPELISLLRKASKSCDCSQNHDIILRYKTNDNQEFFADVKPFLKSQDIVDTPCIDKMVTKHKRVIQHTRLRPYLECDYMIAPNLGDNPMEIAYKTTRRHDFSFPKPTRQFWYFQREPVTVGVVLCRTKCPNCRTIICPPDTCCPVCNPPPKRPVCTRKPMLCSHPPKKCCKCPQSCPPKDCPPMPPCCYQPLPACCSKMSSACCRDICLQTDCATSCRACAAKKTCRVPCFNKPACPDAYCDNKPMCHTRSGCSMRFQCAPRSKCNLHVPSCGSNAVIVCEAPPWPQRSCAAPSRCDICRAFAPCDRKPSCDSFAKYVCASSHCYDVRCESSSSKEN